MFHNWSNGYFHFREGTLEESQWVPFERELKSNADNQMYLTVWEDWKYIYDEPFQELFDGMVADAQATSGE